MSKDIRKTFLFADSKEGVSDSTKRSRMQVQTTRSKRHSTASNLNEGSSSSAPKEIKTGSANVEHAGTFNSDLSLLECDVRSTQATPVANDEQMNYGTILESDVVFYDCLEEEEETTPSTSRLNDETFDEQETSDSTADDFEEPVNDQSSFHEKLFHKKLPHNLHLSVLEVLLMVFEVSVRHNLSYKAIVDILMLLNIVIGFKIIPETKYMFKKVFSADFIKPVYNFYCPNCFKVLKVVEKNVLLSLKKTLMLCDICQVRRNVSNLSENNYFVTLPLKSQIRLIFESEGMNLNFENSMFEADGDCLSDIKDGSEYKRIKEGKENLLTLNLNTDGVQLYNSSKSTMWPVFFTINEMGAKFRFKLENIILGALWFGADEPPMEIYLTPLLMELKEMWQTGVEYTINGVTKVIRVACISALMDSIAKSSTQKIKQFNGYFGCFRCKHPGTPIAVNPTTSAVRYSEDINPPELRSSDKLKANMKIFAETGNSIEGVKGLSPFALLHYFDLSKGFAVDYLHATLLGVCRATTELWLNSKSHDKPYYIGPWINDLDKKIMSQMPPTSTGRLPTEISKRASWKGSAWRNFLLFYALPCLEGYLAEPYLTHFSLLVSAVYKLSKSQITRMEVEEAYVQLKKFVSEYEGLYGLENMLYNVHLHNHLAESVHNFGPLWNFSLFPFESANGHLAKLANGTVACVNQICSKYLMCRAVMKIVKNLDIQKVVARFCECLPQTKRAKEYAAAGDNVVLVKDKWFEHTISYNEEESIHNLLGIRLQSHSSIIGYFKLIINNVKFQGTSYEKPKKTNDCVISFSDNINCEYGIIDKFYYINERIVVIVKVIELVLFDDDQSDLWFVFTAKHIRPCIITNKVTAIEAKSIKTKCFLILVKEENGDDRCFVSDLPNPYECD